MQFKPHQHGESLATKRDDNGHLISTAGHATADGGLQLSQQETFDYVAGL